MRRALVDPHEGAAKAQPHVLIAFRYRVSARKRQPDTECEPMTHRPATHHADTFSTDERRYGMKLKLRALLYTGATLATLLLAAGAKWKPN
jgi:hypothetical protein